MCSNAYEESRKGQQHLVHAMVAAGNRERKIPLNHAMYQFQPCRAIDTLLAIWPDSPRVQDVHGTTAFDISLWAFGPPTLVCLIPQIIRCCPSVVQQQPILSAKGNYSLHRLVWTTYLPALQCVYEAWPEGLHRRNDAGNTPIHQATLEGREVALEYFLSVHPDGAKERNDRGCLPIHLAIQHRHANVVALLLRGWPESRWSVFGNGKNTTLHLAAEHLGLPAITEELLLKDGSDAVRVRNAAGETPIHTAVRCGREVMLERMLRDSPEGLQDVVASTGDTVFHIAARNGQIRVFAWLLSQWPAGVMQLNAKGKSSLDKTNDHEWNPLRHAAATNNADMVKVLLNLQPPIPLHLWDYSVLQQTVASRSKEVLSLLRLHFPDCFTTMRDETGDTVLHRLLSTSTFAKGVHWLLEEASTDQTNELLLRLKGADGNTLWHTAIRFDNMHMLRYLLRRCPEDIFITNDFHQLPFARCRDAAVFAVVVKHFSATNSGNLELTMTNQGVDDDLINAEMALRWVHDDPSAASASVPSTSVPWRSKVKALAFLTDRRAFEDLADSESAAMKAAIATLKAPTLENDLSRWKARRLRRNIYRGERRKVVAVVPVTSTSM